MPISVLLYRHIYTHTFIYKYVYTHTHKEIIRNWLMDFGGLIVPQSSIYQLNQENQWCSSSLSPKAWQPGELNSVNFHLSSEDQIPSLNMARQRSTHLSFYSGLQLIGWDPSTHGGMIGFLVLPVQTLISSIIALTDKHRIMFNQIFAPPLSQSN